ncbi:MAG: sulfatase-like hydrolase/transferase [Acidobacteriota bacterium]
MKTIRSAEPRRAIFAAAALLALTLTGCSRERPWNVVLFTFDTTRADFIGCYGKASARTPNLDGLASEGYLFEYAYASNPVTQAAHSTILTGVYPMVHGVRDNTFFHLPEARQTLAEMLGEAGYDTGAAIGGFPLTEEFGTAQGFDFYDDDLVASRSDFRGLPGRRRFNTWYDERPAGHVNDAILPWLRERGGKPFFAWLHYWDPHEPHIALPPYNQLFAHDPYQGEIAYADESLGALLRELDELGELERTLIVMTADHGEGRNEHREVTHAFLAYDTTIHVPLIVKVPGREGGRRIPERVGTVDIVPTILDLLGLEGPNELQGRSLVELMNDRGASAQNRRPYYSESMSPRLSHGFGELRAFFLGPWKYVHGPRPELFHIVDDPKELNDLAAERPEELQRMETALVSFLADHASSDAADATYEASEETRQRLAALGYLSAGQDSPQTVTEELRTDGAAPQDRVGDINLQGRLRRELGGGQFRQAERTARRLLELSPENAFYRSSLAAALIGLERFDDAARLVEETDGVSEASRPQFLGVARALFEAGEQQRGVTMAQKLAGEDSAEGYLLIAEMRRELGDSKAASAAVDRAFELAPEDPQVRLAYARSLVDRGELPQAEQELERLLTEYPVDLQAQLAYAQLLRADGRTPQALARVERALRLAPRFCEAHHERVLALADLDRSDAALAAWGEMKASCRDRDLVARTGQQLEAEQEASAEAVPAR